ncbi:flavodoxin [Lactobacillus nasalidis]|nr:flavodoxin [Lactobacillus nasalidis]GHV97958.1 flavodoxin [Lactobacillus nasalidis]GHV98938.1 flavodoxin [Lactobacillus nasalidis]
MKKFKSKTILSLFLVGLSLFLAACSSSNTSSSSSSSSAAASSSKTSKNKTLIIYYSWSGSTRQAANYIKKQTGADMVELLPVKSYSTDYDTVARQANRQNKQKAYPAIKKLPSLKQYSTILLGYPTWYSNPPRTFYTLFRDYNFKGKTVIPFTTSMSTPISTSQKDIKTMAQQDGATFKSGIRYDNNKAAVRRWLKKNGLLKE